MKSFVDMIEEAKTLQNNVETLRKNLEQANAASNQKSNTNDILTVMAKAKLSAITAHCLSKQDNPTQEAYLVLLLAVSKQQMQVIANREPLMYPCRIAAGLTTVPDMEELYKKALLGNEKTFDEYLTVIQGKSLQYSLVFDALIMTLLFTDGRLQMLDYVASLASLLAITEQQMQELLVFVKGYMAQEEVVYHTFQYLPEEIIQQCLARYCQKYVIAIQNKAIFHWKSTEEHLSMIILKILGLCQIKDNFNCAYYEGCIRKGWGSEYDVYNKHDNAKISQIQIGNAYFIEDFSEILKKIFPNNTISEMTFERVYFYQEDSLFLHFQRLHNIAFKQCKFINCNTAVKVAGYTGYSSSWKCSNDSSRGIVTLGHCDNIAFASCWFENNRIGGPTECFDNTALHLVYGSVENVIVKDCKKPKGEIKDNNTPLA